MESGENRLMASDVYAGKATVSNGVSPEAQSAEPLAPLSGQDAGLENGSTNRPPLPAFVVGEDFAGMRSQALGLVGRAGWDGSFHAIRPSRMARLALRGPGWLQGRFLNDVTGAPLLPLAAQSRVIVSIGGKGGAIGAALRTPDRPVVQIQHPRQPLTRFDLIVACVHDEISGPNVLLGRTALHGLTPEVLEQARQRWEPRFAHLPRPLIAGLVGGSNGRFQFGVGEAARLGALLAKAVVTQKGSLIVTPSRRTAPEAREMLTDLVDAVGGTVWDGTGENPYVGLIACADHLVVTMDSVSMVSEAVAGAAPVSVFPLPGKSRRIARFISELEKSGRIRVLTENSPHTKIQPWVVTPLDDTPALVVEMHQRLGF